MVLAGLSREGRASAAVSESQLPSLASAGLDPLAVYRKMFASADQNEACYWLYTGPFAVPVEGIGSVFFMQEESYSATRTVDQGPDAFRIDQRLAGILRDVQSGDVISAVYDPRTGDRQTVKGASLYEPTRCTVTRSGNGLSFALALPSVPAIGMSAVAEIKGDRVSLTVDMEYYLGRNTKIGQIQTMKIYSSLTELRSAAPYAASQGFYNTRDRDTGVIQISGLMRKARIDEKLDPLAWDRVRGFFPNFFDGDRISMNWK